MTMAIGYDLDGRINNFHAIGSIRRLEIGGDRGARFPMRAQSDVLVERPEIISRPVKSNFHDNLKYSFAKTFLENGDRWREK